jgi:Family of unknown function (DUF6082)
MSVTDMDDQYGAPAHPRQGSPALTLPQLEGPPQRARATLRRQVLLVATTVLALLATVLLSPLLLLAVQGIFSVDWQTLSDVGQSYTGISALFSVAALTGAVLTIRLQIRQSQVAQEHALRNTQFQLLSLALQDPDLLKVVSLSVPGDADDQLKRKHVFLTMILRHLQFLYLTKDVPETALEETLRSEFFANEEARDHWARVRQHWATSISSTPERTFVATAEKVWTSFRGSS